MTDLLSTDDAIEALALGLLDRTLPKPEWTHRAHFAAALWLLRSRLDFTPERDMPGIIRAYNEATGVTNSDTEGYHETITQASLRAARMVLSQHASDASLAVVLDDLMERPFGNRDWLLAYWTRERLFSAAARRGWLAPDLQDLPF